MSFVKTRTAVTNVISNEDKVRVIHVGGQTITQQVISAQSSSLQNTMWNFNTPSTNTIVNRDWRVRYYVKFTPNDADAGFKDAADAPAMFPIASATANTQLSLNGASTSVQTNLISGALLRYGVTDDDRRGSLSTTAAYPDLVRSYAEAGATMLNPLASYGFIATEDSRGAFPYTLDTSDGSRSYVFTEPVFVSPLVSGCTPTDGFINLSSAQLLLNFSNSLEELMWSHDSTQETKDYDGMSISFYRTPELLLEFITPNAMYVIPKFISYDYYSPTISTQSSPRLSAGAVIPSFSTQTVQLSSIPKRVYIYVQRSNRKAVETSTFCRIDSISCNFNNQSGLLASSSEQQIFNMNYRNGCNLTYTQTHSQVGSVVCVEFGSDIGLDMDLAPGTSGLYNIQFQIGFTNISAAAFDPIVICAYMMQGECTLGNNECSFKLGNISSSDVMNTVMYGPEVHHNILDQGGSFFSGLKSFVNKAASGIGSVARLAAPIVSAINPQYGALVGQAGQYADLAKQASGGMLSGGGLAQHRLKRTTSKKR